MDDDELFELYEALRGLLAEAGLEWVTSEVDAEVASGLTIPAEIKSPEPLGRAAFFRFPNSFDAVRSITVKQSLMNRDYSPQERVEVLLEAVRRAVFDSVALEEVTLASLRELGENADYPPSAVVAGASGEPGPSDRHAILFGSVASDRQDAVQSLGAALAALVARVRES